MALRVAIVGDSAMWGQGIAVEHTFARLAATRLAQLVDQSLDILPGLGAEPGRGHSRSGAKIDAAVDDPERDVDVVLPSGAVTREAAGDRVDFCEMFGSEFDDDAEMRGFLDGVDDRPAAGLFGENPATFPTVTTQVRQLVGSELGATVDVLLIDGWDQ
ncbi:MAG: hypothetical protein H0T66_15595 [Geodermatophilaceae bacterium]|nr:hypothetical protein [Geodermatophilaceae bacterium]